MPKGLLLAGDIGGTKTNLAIYALDEGLRAPRAEAGYPSADYPNFETLVRQFLDEVNLPVERASFGVAGPVVDGRAAVTNLPWQLDERTLQSGLGLSSVRLLNDLESIARAVPLLEPAQLHTLHPGTAVPGGAIAVIAPGTGLGEAYLTWDGRRYRAHPSEGGHADFAPSSDQELELLRYLWSQFGHVSYERVCSGKGVPNLYAFLKDSGYAHEPAWLAEQIAAADDPVPVIVNAALAPQEGAELCVATLDLFVAILGAEAGNLALKIYAQGGVYLGGGIPPRILLALESERFTRAFLHKGRLEPLLGDMPVYVILEPKAALMGAASAGMQDNDAVA